MEVTLFRSLESRNAESISVSDRTKVRRVGIGGLRSRQVLLSLPSEMPKQNRSGLQVQLFLAR